MSVPLPSRDYTTMSHLVWPRTEGRLLLGPRAGKKLTIPSGQRHEAFQWSEVRRGVLSISTWLSASAYFGILAGLYSFGLFVNDPISHFSWILIADFAEASYYYCRARLYCERSAVMVSNPLRGRICNHRNYCRCLGSTKASWGCHALHSHPGNYWLRCHRQYRD